jgi:hypothetical protein
MTDPLYIAAGCWLPVGQTNFYRPTDDHDDDLAGTYRLSHGYPENSSLQASIYRRLRAVASAKGYSSILPLIPAFRVDYPDQSDPVSAILVADRTADPYWKNYAMLRRVSLFVGSDGFYLWIAEVAPEHGAELARARIQLQEHIGDCFCCRDCGDGPRDIDYKWRGEEPNNLSRYLEERHGILSLFQINTILEGMANYAFLPSQFFRETNNRSSANDSFTIGHFVRSIGGTCRPESLAEAAADVANLEPMLNSADAIEGPLSDSANALQKAGWAAYNKALDEVSRRDLIRLFLRYTTAFTLQPLKWYIEAARRALLEETISIIHKPTPLVQIKPPASDREYDFSPYNGDQIRGYVMLMAAKLPLIRNTAHYLGEACGSLDNGDGDNRGSSDDSNVGSSTSMLRDVSAVLASWRALLIGLDENVNELEAAIQQVTSDKGLYEEEQIRAEQEAIAESERIRTRSESGSLETGKSGDGPAWGIHFGNVFWLVAVVIAAVSLFAQGQHPGKSFGAAILSFFAVSGNWVGVAVLVVIAAVLYRLYSWWRVRSERQREERIDKYTYELNLRLDYPIDWRCADALEKGNLEEHEKCMAMPRWINWPFTLKEHRLARTSYRLEQPNKDEILHKIHLEGELLWPTEPGGSEHTIPMETHLVYEVLLHHPSEQPTYALREVRVVGTIRRPLGRLELRELQKMVLTNLVHAEYKQKSDPNVVLIEASAAGPGRGIAASQDG